MEKSAEAFRTISEVADLLETPAHVLRFWESRFPQIKPVKRAGGRRYYRPADVALLQGIRRLLHEDGVTIRGVQKILREQGVRHVAALASDEPFLDADFEEVVEIAETTDFDLTPAPAMADGAEVIPLSAFAPEIVEAETVAAETEAETEAEAEADAPSADAPPAPLLLDTPAMAEAELAPEMELEPEPELAPETELEPETELAPASEPAPQGDLFARSEDPLPEDVSPEDMPPEAMTPEDILPEDIPPEDQAPEDIPCEDQAPEPIPLAAHANVNLFADDSPAEPAPLLDLAPTPAPEPAPKAAPEPAALEPAAIWLPAALRALPRDAATRAALAPIAARARASLAQRQARR